MRKLSIFAAVFEKRLSHNDIQTCLCGKKQSMCRKRLLENDILLDYTNYHHPLGGLIYLSASFFGKARRASSVWTYKKSKSYYIFLQDSTQESRLYSYN